MLLAAVPERDQAEAEQVIDNLKSRLDKMIVAITTRVRSVICLERIGRVGLGTTEKGS
jgi:hypothetical protein